MNDLSNFKHEIETMNLYDKLNKNLFADPTENYNLLSNKLSEAKQLHMPDKIVKYRKHKHKKSTWITIGVTSWRGKPTRIRFVVGSGKRPKVQCIISDAQIMRNSKISIYRII